jgi:4-hydroxy-tetrahydrodipicolinate synthase
VPALAGAAEANVHETRADRETYADCGARAVAIVSPFYFKLSPESVCAYFREVARHCPIDAPTIRRLAEFERIIGIMDISGDMALMMYVTTAVRPVRRAEARYAGDLHPGPSMNCP